MVLEALGGVLGAKCPPRPPQRHFRVRKPRSWVALLGGFLGSFSSLFGNVFFIFSRRPPEQHFVDFVSILGTFLESFVELCGEGWIE